MNNIYEKIIIILIVILVIELFIFILINFLKKKILWIITNEDEYPIFDKSSISNFIRNKFDKKLGWDWKKNSKYIENYKNTKNLIEFGKDGERLDKSNKLKPKFISLGDSFVYCRYTKSDKTWQSKLGQKNFPGLNFGVGNYGLDQILLKYISKRNHKNIKYVFIGIVPETLSRCLCGWKHYHEFGNIFGFKPKFVIDSKRIVLKKNPLKNKLDLHNSKKIINRIKKKEFFYKYKFIKKKFIFPYSFSLIKNFSFNFQLLYYSICSLILSNKNQLYDFIQKINCVENDELFKLKKNQKLINALFEKFSIISKKRKQKLIFLIFPQRNDILNKNDQYHNFFENLKKKYDIIDFTKYFIDENINKLYLEPEYGSHLTNYGNKLVAKIILKKLKKNYDRLV